MSVFTQEEGNTFRLLVCQLFICSARIGVPRRKCRVFSNTMFKFCFYLSFKLALLHLDFDGNNYFNEKFLCFFNL